MIIPYSTDAPIYHWPIATVGMILLNIGVYIACVSAATEAAPAVDPNAEVDPTQMITQYMGGGGGDDPYEEVINPYILHYGRLWPPEWVTSNFIHADLFHLLGNMFGLWGLGLIVEGKVGWWRFLLIFLGIGIGQCAMEQVMTLGMDGGSLGASSIVFGLLAICLIWAPKNELSCVMFWGHRISAIDIGVVSYCIILFSLEIVMMAFSSMTSGISITSAVLHFMGALVGAVIGVALLKLDWVDCEQWDLFTVLAGRAGQRPQRKAKKAVEEPESPEMLERRREMALSQIRELTAKGDPQLAYAAHKRMSRDFQRLAAFRQRLPEIDRRLSQAATLGRFGVPDGRVPSPLPGKHRPRAVGTGPRAH